MSWPLRIATLSKGVGVSLQAFMASQSDGLWYDFSKTARLWQNNPPTTPADDAGEVIGLVFDARLGAGPWATNLCTWSQDISNAAWTKTDITVGATTTAPDGTSTAALATAGSAGSDTLTSALGTVVAGSTNTVRIRLKKSGHQWLRLAFTDATGTDGFNQWVDLTNGVLGSSTLRGAGTKISATMTADAFGFYLVTLRGVVSTRTTLNLLIVSASADGSVTRVNGATYYPWGCEIVAGSYSGAYIPTTSIPVTAPGNQAVQATAGFKPTYQAAGGKFDAADDNLLTAYLAQSGATNLCTWSQDISNAAWTKTDITVGAATTAPDGTATAALATAGSAGSDTLASAPATIVASSTNTIRIRLKKSASQWLRLVFADSTGTDGFNQWVDLTNGALGTSTLRGAGTKISATMTADAFGFYLVTLRGVVSTRTTLNLSVVSASADGSMTRVNGATYYPWGCEIVAGSYSGAYIPTTSIPVTAGPGANFIIAYVEVPATLAATQVVAGASGAAANRCFLAFNTSGQLCAGVGSDSTATIVGTTDWRGQTVVVGLSFDGSTVKLFAGTAEEYSAAQNSTPTTTIPFRIGALNNNGTAGSFCGHYVKWLLAGRQALTLAQFKSIRTQLIAGA